MLSEGPTTQDARKRRLQGACDMCYKRKVKCDSAEKPDHRCTNCVMSKLQCTHARSKYRSTPQGFKTAQEHIAEILSTSTVYIPTKDSAVAHGILVQVAIYARELEQTVASLMPQSAFLTTPPDPGPLSQTYEWADDTSPATVGILADAYMRALPISDESTQDRHPMSFSEPQKSDRFHGKSSSVQFVRSAIKYMNGNNYIYAIQRPEFWMTAPWEKLTTDLPRFFFPDEDLLVTLVQIYFARVNPIYCILHSRSFQQSIANGQHFRDPDFGAVVLAVCAVASRYSNDRRVFIDGANSEHSCGWKWFRQVRILRTSVSPKPSLNQLQLIALSVLYLSGNSHPEECWIMAALGVRLAQGAGAHLRAEYSHMDPLDRELYKRVFWQLVIADILTSSFKGRPPVTHEIDLDVDLPADVADEYWGVPLRDQLTAAPSSSAFFVPFLRMMQIYGKIQREIYPANGHMCEPEKVLELSSELNNWANSVPEHLRWDPNQENQIFLDQSAAIYAVYYHAQILIHRPFIPVAGKPTVNTNFPSLAICANAARSCGHVLDVQARRGRGVLYHPHLMSALFESAIVLLINVWTVVGGNPCTAENFHRAAADVQNSVGVLRMYERRWRSAGIKGDILSALLNLGKPPPASLTSRPPFLQEAAAHPIDASSLASTASLAQQRQELELSAQEPSHLFSLPIHAEELGRLPIYDSFEYAFNENLQSTLHNEMPTFAQTDWGDMVTGDAGPMLPPSFDVDVSSTYTFRDWSMYLSNESHPAD